MRRYVAEAFLSRLWSVTMAGDGVIIGVAARTGWAVAISLGGVGSAPRFAARCEIAMSSDDVPAQPYHEAVGLDVTAAEELIGRAEKYAEDAAAAALLSMAGDLPAGVAVVGVAVVVKAVSLPESLTQVLRSHAWMHAAEGVLYREALLAGARRNGWPAHAVEEARLPAAGPTLAALGSVAGRPWRRYEKDAARAAMSRLAG